MVMALAAPAAAYEDEENSWAKSSIERWSRYGVLNGDEQGNLNGDEQGNLNPDERITRGEFSDVLANMMGYTVKAENTFPDLKEGDRHADAVLKLVAAGVMKGDGVNANPNELISRQESAVLLCRAMDIDIISSANLDFDDSGSVSDWAKGAMATLYEKGMINGVGANKIAPKEKINLASVAKLLDNMVSTYANEDGAVITGDQSGVVIVAANNVKVENAALRENLIVAPAAANGSVTVINTTSAADVVVSAPGASLSLDENSTVAGVAVTADNTITTVSGKANSVITTAKATVTVSNTAKVGSVTVAGANTEVSVAGQVENLTVAGANTEVFVDGQVENLTVANTADSTSLNVEKGATVAKVETAADGVEVEGSGKVGNMTVTDGEDVTVSKETKVNKVINNSDSTVSVGGKNVASGSTGSSSGSSGSNSSSGSSSSSGSGGGSSTPSVTYTDVDVSAAILNDCAASNPKTMLVKENTYKVTARKASDKDYVDVTITAAALQEHTNGESKPGNWIGFALAAPEGATNMKVAFAATQAELKFDEEYYDIEKSVTLKDEDGVAFYTNAGAETPKTWAMVQWFKAEETAAAADRAETEPTYAEVGPAVTYKMDLSGVTLGYTITFAGEDIKIEPQLVVKGGTATAPATPTKNGYEAGGWLIEDEYSFDTPVTKDITLKPDWTQVVVTTADALTAALNADGVRTIVVKGTIGGTNSYGAYNVAKDVTIQNDKSGGTVYGFFTIADHATLTINGTVEGDVKGAGAGSKLMIGENGTYSNLTEGTYIWTIINEDGSDSGWVETHVES